MLKYVFFCSGTGVSVLGGFFSLGLFVLLFMREFFQPTGFGKYFYFMMLDNSSSSLIMLSSWIIYVSVFAMVSQKKKYVGYFLMNLVLFVLLLLVFSIKLFFMFYVVFEASLIPIFFIILGWGYQPERISAGVYMLIYTVFASLPLLYGLLFGPYMLFSPFMIGAMEEGVKLQVCSFLFIMVYFFAFFVKLPVYMVHVWLPKAHVEAPVGGSMVLAGILLKLGGYGLLRLIPSVWSVLWSSLWFWVSFGVVGGSLVSMLCVVQSDLKGLIAYSSVSHMSLVLGGLLSGSEWGSQGSVMLMIGHGLSSSGLFYGAGCLYFRSGSRSVVLNKGVLMLLPGFSLMWFILCASNMAAPPSLNLLSELLLVTSIMIFSKFLIIPLMVMSFFSAVYSLFLYSSSQHGRGSESYSCVWPVNLVEYFVLFSHSIPMFLLPLFGVVWSWDDMLGLLILFKL